MDVRKFITPNLRRWIIAQVEAGYPVEGLLQAMKDGGWSEATALDALESTLRLKAAEVEGRASKRGTGRLPAEDPPR